MILYKEETDKIKLVARPGILLDYKYECFENFDKAKNKEANLNFSGTD